MNKKLPNISSKFNNVFYIDRCDINFWSQVGYQRFSSIEHLASYVLNSNNIQPSQLTLECKWDLGKLPQIKYLVSENESLLSSFPSITSRSKKVCRNDLNIFQYIYNPNFWNKLIRNYVTRAHRYVSVFYLKDLDLKTIPQSLLNAVYCLGYIYSDQKSEELTEYMNQLGNINYRRIVFKPSLSNIQTLIIHQHILYIQGKIAEARSCLLHITKMCYMLGFHINTKKILRSSIYTRDLVFSRVLYTHLAMAKVHKVSVNFLVDAPNINKVCYDAAWQLLPKETAKYIKLDEKESELFSALIALNIELRNRSGMCLIFSNLEAYTNKQIYKICLDRHSSLFLIHSRYMRGYEMLLNKFPEHYKLLLFDREEFDAHYLHLSILIFEYGRFKSKGINHKIVQKIMNLCDKLMTSALVDGKDLFHRFGIYLTVITCVQIFKYLKQSQQKKLISNLYIVKKLLFNNLGSASLLLYLLFDKSIELIKN